MSGFRGGEREILRQICSTLYMRLIYVRIAARGEHVMISYSWESQETVMRIREELKTAGFKVWIDYENMEQICTYNQPCSGF